MAENDNNIQSIPENARKTCPNCSEFLINDEICPKCRTKLSRNFKEDLPPATNLKGYLIFLIGQWISQMGSNIVGFGIIWFLTITTDSAFILGLSTFLGFAPFLLVTPIAGVFIDRWSRKRVIIFVDAMQAVFTGLLILTFMAGFTDFQIIVILLSLNTVRGVFGAFHTAAVDTLLPIMVPREELSRINGINYFVNGAIAIVGPVAGAVALKLFPIQELLWLDVITFLIAIIPTIFVVIPKIMRQEKPADEESSFSAEFKEGLGFIRSTPGLFSLLFVFTGANFFLPPFFTQLPLFVSSIHLGDEIMLGILSSLQQIGLLSGSLIMSTWKGFANHAKGVTIGLFLGYTGVIIFLLAPVGNVVVLGLGLFITGFVLPVANVSSEAIWGATVPRELLGRVYATRRTIAQGLAPISMLLSGILAELFGLIPIMSLFSTIGLLVLGYSWFFTSLPDVEKKIDAKLKS